MPIEPMSDHDAHMALNDLAGESRSPERRGFMTNAQRTRLARAKTEALGPRPLSGPEYEAKGRYQRDVDAALHSEGCERTRAGEFDIVATCRVESFTPLACAGFILMQRHNQRRPAVPQCELHTDAPAERDGVCGQCRWEEEEDNRRERAGLRPYRMEEL